MYKTFYIFWMTTFFLIAIFKLLWVYLITWVELADKCGSFSGF